MHLTAGQRLSCKKSGTAVCLHRRLSAGTESDADADLWSIHKFGLGFTLTLSSIAGLARPVLRVAKFFVTLSNDFSIFSI